jgi:hypothetical protein
LLYILNKHKHVASIVIFRDTVLRSTSFGLRGHSQMRVGVVR